MEIYDQTDTKEKRNRNLPSVKLRPFLWGRSQTTVPADGRFVWSYSETEKMITRTDPMIQLQRYKYNGKELDLMHGLKWYDYGARMYDPILLTWNAIDPLCEEYYGISPYVYCKDNPIKYLDPNGLDGLISIYGNNIKI